ncbi:hypothetical protein BsWGS_01255 [Bradybaena similaris]
MSLSETEMGLPPWEQIMENDARYPSLATRSDSKTSSILSDVEQQDPFSDRNTSEDEQLPSKKNQEVDENLMFTLKSPKFSDDSNNDDFHHDLYTQYDQHFPLELRHNLDIAIIHDEADEDEAHNLKRVIEKYVQLEIEGECFKPKVELLKNVTPRIHVDPLDYALEVAVCLIVYVTNNFLENKLCNFEGTASLKAIISRDKEYSLVCVHTDQSTSKKLGAHLRSVKQLIYSKDKQEQFIENVTNHFDQISDILIQNKSKLTQCRKQYFDKNLAHLNRQESSSNKGNFSPRKTNVAEMDKSSQHDQVHQQLASSKDKNTGTGKQTASAYYVDRESEIYEESSGKDTRRQQMGLQRGLDCNKSCDSSPLKTPTVQYTSLPEPADDKAIPEDPTPNAFNPTGSNVNFNGSHRNPPTGHSGSQVHIHIHQATNVVIGEHGYINAFSRSQGADDS